MDNRIHNRRALHLLLVLLLTAVFCLAVHPLQGSAYSGKSSFKYVSSTGRNLANELNRGVQSMVDIGTRGLCLRKNLWELNETKTVACIFETGSIKYDNEIFTEQHDEYGRGLAMGLCSYLGVKFAG